MAAVDYETLSHAVADHARTTPHEEAFVSGARRVSWAELGTVVDTIARALARHGVTVGSRIAICLEDPLEFVHALFGVLRAGGVAVPLPERFDDSSAAGVVADCGAGVVIRAAPTSSGRDPAVLLMRELVNGASAHDGMTLPSVARSSDFGILYSSGTTSRPKGVIHTHGARLAAAARDVELFALDGSTRTLITTPLYTGMTWSTLLPTMHAGGCCVLAPRVTAGELPELLQRERPTLIKVVPTQLELFLQSDSFAPAHFASLRTLLYGGARASQALRTRIWSTFGDIATEVYGATEAGPISYLRGPNDDKVGSVGTPLPGVTVAVVDDTGNETATNVLGRVVVHSDSLLRCYTRGDVTAVSIAGRRFVPVGDVGRIDDDGYLWIAGRGSDVIISAGHNIHATDLEEILLQHAAVREAAVVGLPNAVLGETPVGFVVLREDSRESADDVCRWANARLNGNQRLCAVTSVPGLPRTPSGKVAKKQLHDLLNRSA
jgi:long-chain acyl-CoA synthetase